MSFSLPTDADRVAQLARDAQAAAALGKVAVVANRYGASNAEVAAALADGAAALADAQAPTYQAPPVPPPAAPLPTAGRR